MDFSPDIDKISPWDFSKLKFPIYQVVGKLDLQLQLAPHLDRFPDYKISHPTLYYPSIISHWPWDYPLEGASMPS